MTDAQAISAAMVLITAIICGTILLAGWWGKW